MCKVLKISRNSYYYEASQKPDETELESKIETIFHNNRDVYGSRKIKRELGKEALQVSRRRICRINTGKSSSSICKGIFKRIKIDETTEE